MHWSIYVAIGVASLILIYLIFVFCVFCRVFGRYDDVFLDETDLTGTHYEPYTEKLYREMAVMRKRQKREVNCRAKDGVKLSGDYYDNKGEKLALLVHGYRSRTINNFSVSGNSLISHGYDLLMIHQRSYGRSGGLFTSMGRKEQYDVLCWIDWIKANTNIKQIILYGVSMGGYTVSCASDKVDENFVKAIVEDCGFCSPYEELKYVMQGQKFLRFLAMPMFCLYARIFIHVNFKRKNTECLAKSKVPVIFIHGKSDDYVPASCAEQGYEACSAPKDICLIEKAGHTASFLVDTQTVEHKLYSFLEKYI